MNLRRIAAVLSKETREILRDPTHAGRWRWPCRW